MTRERWDYLYHPGKRECVPQFSDDLSLTDPYLYDRKMSDAHGFLCCFMMPHRKLQIQSEVGHMISLESHVHRGFEGLCVALSIRWMLERYQTSSKWGWRKCIQSLKLWGSWTNSKMKETARIDWETSPWELTPAENSFDGGRDGVEHALSRVREWHSVETRFTHIQKPKGISNRRRRKKQTIYQSPTSHSHGFGQIPKDGKSWVIESFPSRTKDFDRQLHQNMIAWMKNERLNCFLLLQTVGDSHLERRTTVNSYNHIGNSQHKQYVYFRRISHSYYLASLSPLLPYHGPFLNR
jgi:hypothetical protein